MGFNVTVVSKSESFDWTEFATGLVRVGEIDVTSVDDMVNKIVQNAKAKSAKIDRLDIFAHGTNTYIKIGKDEIHSYTPNKHSPSLNKLRGSFAADGIIVLNVCDIGQSESTVTAIASAAKVNVFACDGSVSPNLNVWWGTVVVGRPDGTFQRKVRIPTDPWEGVQS